MRVSQIQIDYLALQLSSVYRDASQYAERLAERDLTPQESALLLLEHRRKTVERALDAVRERWGWTVQGDAPP